MKENILEIDDTQVSQDYLVIGRRIAELRELKGIGLSELCLETGLSLRSVSLLEKGKRNPSYDTLLKIGRVLGYTLDFVENK